MSVFKRAFNRRARRAKAPALRPPWLDSGLHVCSACRGDFVHAIQRRRESDVLWLLRLRCGQCDVCRDVVVSDELVRRFDEDVSRDVAAIAGAVATLDQERMSALVDVFAAALQDDLIDAGDFRR